MALALHISDASQALPIFNFYLHHTTNVIVNDINKHKNPATNIDTSSSIHFQRAKLPRACALIADALSTHTFQGTMIKSIKRSSRLLLTGGLIAIGAASICTADPSYGPDVVGKAMHFDDLGGSFDVLDTNQGQAVFDGKSGFWIISPLNHGLAKGQNVGYNVSYQGIDLDASNQSDAPVLTQNSHQWNFNWNHGEDLNGQWWLGATSYVDSYGESRLLVISNSEGYNNSKKYSITEGPLEFPYPDEDPLTRNELSDYNVYTDGNEIPGDTNPLGGKAFSIGGKAYFAYGRGSLPPAIVVYNPENHKLEKMPDGELYLDHMAPDGVKWPHVGSSGVSQIDVVVLPFKVPADATWNVSKEEKIAPIVILGYMTGDHEITFYALAESLTDDKKGMRVISSHSFELSETGGSDWKQFSIAGGALAGGGDSSEMMISLFGRKFGEGHFPYYQFSVGISNEAEFYMNAEQSGNVPISYTLPFGDYGVQQGSNLQPLSAANAVLPSRDTNGIFYRNLIFLWSLTSLSSATDVETTNEGNHYTSFLFKSNILKKVTSRVINTSIPRYAEYDVSTSTPVVTRFMSGNSGDLYPGANPNIVETTTMTPEQINATKKLWHPIGVITGVPPITIPASYTPNLLLNTSFVDLFYAQEERYMNTQFESSSTVQNVADSLSYLGMVISVLPQKAELGPEGEFGAAINEFAGVFGQMYSSTTHTVRNVNSTSFSVTTSSDTKLGLTENPEGMILFLKPTYEIATYVLRDPSNTYNIIGDPGIMTTSIITAGDIVSNPVAGETFTLTAPEYDWVQHRDENGEVVTWPSSMNSYDSLGYLKKVWYDAWFHREGVLADLNNETMSVLGNFSPPLELNNSTTTEQTIAYTHTDTEASTYQTTSSTQADGLMAALNGYSKQNDTLGSTITLKSTLSFSLSVGGGQLAAGEKVSVVAYIAEPLSNDSPWIPNYYYPQSRPFLMSYTVGLKDTNVDVDQDHIDDDWEMQYFGSLDVVDSFSDYDQDGALDALEYYYAINPTETDSDADNILDGAEIEFDLDPAISDLNAYNAVVKSILQSPDAVGEITLGQPLIGVENGTAEIGLQLWYGEDFDNMYPLGDPFYYSVPLEGSQSFFRISAE